MSNEKFYNRAGYVTFEENGRVIDEFRGLNFKFSYEATSSPTLGRIWKADVGILGLSGDRVIKWSSFCNHTTPSRYGKLTGGVKFVSVYAGYENTFSETPLFTLPIAGAWPTQPPDMWLNISAFTSVPLAEKYVELSMHATDKDTYFTIYDIGKEFGEKIGARVKWQIVNTQKKFPKLKDVSVCGKVSDIVKWINELGDFVACIKFGYPDYTTPILVITEKGMKIDEVESDNNNATIRISSKTGMIGLPKVMAGAWRAGQIEVTTMLRKDIDVGSKFIVDSEYIQYASETDVFVANKVKSVGEYRGTPWYTTITGLPARYFKK